MADNSNESGIMRLIRYLLVHALFGVALYYGIFEDVEGARRIALFWTWFLIVMSWFIFSDRVVEAAAKKERTMPVPVWFDVALDVAVLSVLVWHGWVVTGAFYLLHIVFCMVMREKVAELRKAEDHG